MTPSPHFLAGVTVLLTAHRKTPFRAAQELHKHPYWLARRLNGEVRTSPDDATEIAALFDRSIADVDAIGKVVKP